MQTSELVLTRKSTQRLVKILNSTYAKANLKQVADNETRLNAEERPQLLELLEYFEDLFDGMLGDWDTETIGLELNTYSKPFNCK